VPIHSPHFNISVVTHLRNTVGADYFLVGEYWRGEVGLLLEYLKLMDYEVSLFDVPLLGRFAATSKMAGGHFHKIIRSYYCMRRHLFYQRALENLP
jgi:alpha-amylase